LTSVSDLGVPCPDCGAGVGQHCHGVRRANGLQRERATPHPGRLAALARQREQRAYDRATYEEGPHHGVDCSDDEHARIISMLDAWRVRRGWPVPERELDEAKARHPSGQPWLYMK
jgi:hypothetical protein